MILLAILLSIGLLLVVHYIYIILGDEFLTKTFSLSCHFTPSLPDSLTEICDVISDNEEVREEGREGGRKEGRKEGINRLWAQHIYAAYPYPYPPSSTHTTPLIHLAIIQSVCCINQSDIGWVVGRIR